VTEPRRNLPSPFSFEISQKTADAIPGRRPVVASPETAARGTLAGFPGPGVSVVAIIRTLTVQNDVSRTRGVRPGHASERLPKGRDHRVLDPARNPNMAASQVQVPWPGGTAFFTDGRRSKSRPRKGLRSSPWAFGPEFCAAVRVSVR